MISILPICTVFIVGYCFYKVHEKYNENIKSQFNTYTDISNERVLTGTLYVYRNNKSSDNIVDVTKKLNQIDKKLSDLEYNDFIDKNDDTVLSCKIIYYDMEGNEVLLEFNENEDLIEPLKDDNSADPIPTKGVPAFRTDAELAKKVIFEVISNEEKKCLIG